MSDSLTTTYYRTKDGTFFWATGLVKRTVIKSGLFIEVKNHCNGFPDLESEDFRALQEITNKEFDYEYQGVLHTLMLGSS